MKHWGPTGPSTALLCIAFTLASCWTESFDNISEYDAVVTVYDPSFDFQQARTYAMPDTVYDLSDHSYDPGNEPTSWDELILAETAAQMAQAGYTRVYAPEDAAVVVLVGIVISETWVMSGTHPWWSDYYWYDEWFFYYPSSAYPVSLTTGSIIIVMLDAEDADLELRESAVVWGAGMRGLQGDSSADRIQWAIEQSFVQSQYLNTEEADK